MSKIAQGGGTVHTHDKNKIIPDAAPFNRRAHWREHEPQTPASGSTDAGWKIKDNATTITVDSVSTTPANNFNMGSLTNTIETWNVGGFDTTTSAKAVQIPLGFGGIYIVSALLFCTSEALTRQIASRFDAFDVDPVGGGASALTSAGNSDIFYISGNGARSFLLVVQMNCPELSWVALTANTASGSKVASMSQFAGSLQFLHTF